MSSAEKKESIHQFICSHSSAEAENADFKDLCVKWMELCEVKLGISLNYVRCKMDQWFMKSYLSRNHLKDVVTDHSGRMQTMTDKLYWRFFEEFDKIIEKEGVLEKMKMGAEKTKIKTKYAPCPGDWVDLAVKCVDAEFDLLNNYMAHCQQCEQVQQLLQANEQIQVDINEACQIQSKINEGIKTLSKIVSDLSILNEKQEEHQGHYRAFQSVSAVLPRQNGTVPNQQFFQTQLQQIDTEINTVTEQVQSQHQQVSELFQDLRNMLSKLVVTLESKVKEWQREFQFDYAELAASANLEKQVAPWCAQTGTIIHDVLHKSVVNWQSTLRNLPSNSCESLIETCRSYEQSLQCMMIRLIESTFIVTEQANFFIKTGNKRFPKFCVRVLAADYFSRRSEETTAHFVSEEDLKSCWKKKSLDLKMLQKVERKLSKNKQTFVAENDRDKLECSFQSLQFASTFKRAQKDPSKQVHEEKYRVVFTTEVEGTNCWTLSLPLVVTTASNQEVHSLASIMWQCFSTDVFHPASIIPEELPWSTVANMLQAKMSRLSKKHRLSNENITHLKNRLFGEDNLPDDTLVSLTAFCWNAMQDTEFSFWKWFLGVYNLIEQYLQQFWHDGLIMGFVKKESAEKMMENCNKAGAFILRFSDKHFTNSDGRKSVYGRLTSCVVVMKDVKGNKRNSLGQSEPVKQKVVEHVDVADFRKLEGDVRKLNTEECPRNNLANILKETTIKSRDGENHVHMYCYLYPSCKSREELFDKYCEEGSTVSGYKHTRAAYIAILEQTMSKMKIEPRTDESVGTDTQLGAAKKARRYKDTTDRVKRSPRGSSSCHSNVSTPQGSPLPAQSPLSPRYPAQSPGYPAQSPGYPAQSPGYPAQSPGYPGSSPAQSVPSPALVIQPLQRQLNTDSMAPNLENKSQLPTVLGEGFSESSISRHSHSFQESKRTLHSTGSRSVFQVEATTSISGQTMEISSENMPFVEPVLSTCSDEQNQSFTAQLFSPEDTMVTDMTMGGVCTESIGHVSMGQATMQVGGESMLVSEADLCCENPDNQQVFIVVNNGGHMDLDRVTDTGQNFSFQPVINYLSSHLTQEQFQLVQTWLVESQVPTETIVQPAPGPVVDSGLSNTPVTTSSGSSVDLCGFSGNQLAAMGSGDIDPSFAFSITGSDT